MKNFVSHNQITLLKLIKNRQNAWLILSLVLLMFLPGMAWGQTVTLATYNFNNTLTPESGAIGSPVLTSSGTAFSTYGGACEGTYNLRFENTGNYVDVAISTLGYKNIQVSWIGKSASTGTYSVVLSGNSGSGYGTIYTQNLTTSCVAVSAQTLGGAFDDKSSINIRFTGSGSNTYIDHLVITGELPPSPGSTKSVVFNYTGSNQTFPVPSCVTSITVEAWGGGGGGFDGSSDGGGKGGGGGAYAKRIINNPSGTYSMFVGAGGGEGANGSASTFATDLVIADYGRGGTSATTGGGEGGTGNSSYDDYANGGNGGNGTGSSNNDRGGGGGGAGGKDGAGLPGNNDAGAGGAGDNGSGGAGGSAGGGDGIANILGGGGGGGASNGNEGGNGGAPGAGGGGGENNGGSGANGQIIVTYTLPNNPTIALSATSTEVCYSASAQNATFTYTATSGCPDKYSIDFTSGVNDVPETNLPASPISIAVPAGLTAGNYSGTLTVKNSTYGFVSNYNITVMVNALPTFTTTYTDITCFGAGNGTITVNNVTGGTSPYSFSIDNGTNFQSGNTFNSLLPAIYKIRVEDGNGCKSPLCP